MTAYALAFCPVDPENEDPLVNRVPAAHLVERVPVVTLVLRGTEDLQVLLVTLVLTALLDQLEFVDLKVTPVPRGVMVLRDTEDPLVKRVYKAILVNQDAVFVVLLVNTANGVRRVPRVFEVRKVSRDPVARLETG